MRAIPLSRSSSSSSSLLMRIALAALGPALLGCGEPREQHPHVAPGPLAQPEPASPEDADAARARGRTLFTHVWTPGDEESAAGDGLGPLFNASSCVACHAQGGVGGAGGAHVNVNSFPAHHLFGAQLRADEQPLSNVFGIIGTMSTRPQSTAVSNAIGNLGLSGPSPSFAAGPRNATALFGAGLLDEIPDAVLEQAALDAPTVKGVQGRVARTPEGRVGRFGWKGDVPNLSEFVARACAVEVGLEVPGVAQRGPAAPGVDLSLEDVEALTTFVAALPPPERAPLGAAARAGEQIFGDIGCTACHREALGHVDGVYSDLLLHDMGTALADGGAAWGQRSDDVNAQLWRTAPLWGVRDSGPWLHDGRAKTLEQAIHFHGGEAQRVMFEWRALPESERVALVAFLESLVAPGA